MAINRGKVNALVDDDGSGTVGTQYKKQNVVDIYDDVDAYVGPFGQWVTRAPFAGGNFTGSGAMTVTVDPADAVSDDYRRFERTITYTFYLDSVSTGGTASTDIRITLPLGLVAARTIGVPFYYIENGVHGAALLQATAGLAYLRCLKASFANWAISANGISLIGQIDVPTTT